MTERHEVIIKNESWYDPKWIMEELKCFVKGEYQRDDGDNEFEPGPPIKINITVERIS